MKRKTSSISLPDGNSYTSARRFKLVEERISERLPTYGYVRCDSCGHTGNVENLDKALKLINRGFCSSCNSRQFSIVKQIYSESKALREKTGATSKPKQGGRRKPIEPPSIKSCEPGRKPKQTPEDISIDVKRIKARAEEIARAEQTNDDAPKPEIITRDGYKYMRRHRL